MADFLIDGLTAGGALALTDLVETQTPGAAATQKSTLTQVQTALGLIKNNYAATGAPTLTDDSSAGYAVGSSWLIPGTGEMWRARAVTAGAARWVKLDVADHPGYVAGRKYVPFGQGSPAAGAAGTAGTTFLAFGVIKERITISEMHIRLTSAGGTNFALAIYAHDPNTGRPTGPPVATSVNGSSAATGPITVALSANAQLEPGNYWFAYMADAGTAVYFSQGNSSTNHLSLIGASGHPIGNGVAVQNAGFSTPGTFGTWPDMTAATLTEQSTRAPLLGFTVASVP